MQSNPARILQIGKYFPPDIGGMETAVHELCNGLSDNPKIALTCIASNSKAIRKVEVWDKYSIIRLARLGVIASTPLNKGLAKEVSRVKPDLIHFHLPNPLVTWQMRNCNTPYVVTYHCDILRYPKLFELYRPVLRHFLKRAQKIIVTSTELMKSSPVLSEFESKCEVVPLGIDPKHFEIKPQEETQVQNIRNCFEGPIVLFVGRLVPYKGLSYLIDAMKTVAGHLLIVGDGPSRKSLDEHIAKINLKSRVTLTGYLPNDVLKLYYHAASIVALVSIDESEALGLSLVQGLACQKPLLSTNLATGIRMVNIDGVTGLQVPPSSSNEISLALNKMIASEEMTARFAKAARLHFEDNFSNSAMTEAHTHIYRNILGHDL